MTETNSGRTLELALEAPNLRDILEEGRYRQDTLSYIARPLGIEQGKVRFELVSDQELARPGGLKVWLQAIRAPSLTATATPCLAVLLYGLWAAQPIQRFVAITAMLGALVLQLSVNLWNDAEDYRRLIDLPGTFGGAGVIQKGWLTARTVRRVAIGCLVAGLLLGVPALVRAPLQLLGIGGLALVGTAGYSGWPLGFKYKALGDLTVLLLCGPGLTLGFAYAAFGQADGVTWALGGYFGAAAVAILHTNNLQDIDVDRQRGAFTLATLLGVQGGKAYLVLIYFVVYASWTFGWSLTHLPLLALLAPLLALPLIVRMCARILRARDLHAPELAMIRWQAAQLHLLLGVTLCIGLGVAIAVR